MSQKTELRKDWQTELKKLANWVKKTSKIYEKTESQEI